MDSVGYLGIPSLPRPQVVAIDPSADAILVEGGFQAIDEIAILAHVRKKHMSRHFPPFESYRYLCTATFVMDPSADCPAGVILKHVPDFRTLPLGFGHGTGPTFRRSARRQGPPHFKARGAS